MGVVRAGGKAGMQVDKMGLTEKVICEKDLKEMRENHELSGGEYVLDQRGVGAYGNYLCKAQPLPGTLVTFNKYSLLLLFSCPSVTQQLPDIKVWCKLGKHPQ